MPTRLSPAPNGPRSTWRKVLSVAGRACDYIGAVVIAAAVLTVAVGGYLAFFRPDELAAHDVKPSDLPPNLLWWILAVIAAGFVTERASRRIAWRAVARRAVFAPGRSEPPVSLPVDLLGRRWAEMMASAYAVVIAALTGLGALAAVLIEPPHWTVAVCWIAACPLSCRAAFKAGRREDELGFCLNNYDPPSTGDLWYDEAGFQERIARYQRWVRFYEEHGLHDPSPEVFTDEQCARLRVAYDKLLDMIAAWEQGQLRPAPGSSLEPIH